MVGYLILIIGLILLILFLVLYIKHKNHVKKIKTYISKINENQIEQIYHLIQNIGTETPNGAFLVPIKQDCLEEKFEISIPDKLDSPWAGKTFSISLEEPLSIQTIETTTPNYQLGKTKFRIVLTPRIKTKTGKLQNIWDIKRYISSSSKLKNILSSISTEFAEDILVRLIMSTGYSRHYEPLDQIRIGSGLGWVQPPDIINCTECNIRMKFLFQFPGTYITNKKYHEAVIYAFGCPKHQNKIQSVLQFY